MKVNPDLNRVMRFGRQAMGARKLKKGTVVVNGTIPVLIAGAVIPLLAVLWVAR